ncbi:MAG: NAD(P)/FAD-dependent oxidoreductase [Beijerinckiaceae bacterium]|nr:MAG: NAD(P)/FAD-dependent oxidoreductase [Beijerinckiaceae bacterium]
MAEAAAYDAAIIGGGHNGLVCAFYLAAAGLKTVVLERRDKVGGAAVTEEFSPGFRNSVAAYTVSLLNPKIIHDLDLARHGLKIVPRQIDNFLPFEDGRFLKLAPGRTKDEVAKFSTRDAERLEAYGGWLESLADVLRGLVLETPPNRTGGDIFGSLHELMKTGRLANRLRRLGLATERDLIEILTASAGDLLDHWFESAPIKAAYGFDGIVGHYASPYTQGSAYVLLHHCFGGINGQKGRWGHAIGGMGAISEAMAKAAREKGATIRVSSGVKNVLVENGRAIGVVTERGETICARAIIANVNPKLLYRDLIEQAALPEDFRSRIAKWRCGSGTFRMNVALSELPDFSALPGRALAEHHTAGIIIAPSLAYMEEAWFDARKYGWARKPIVEMVISSSLDPTLAPEGRHVASLFCQHVAPELPDGASWDDHRETVADLMIATMDTYAPNFKNAILARQIMSPLDLERTFGLVGGDIFHGQLDLGQMFSARPMLGHADYRGPLKGLYMCGSGTHPGGGVSGAPGHNAAREILRDFKRRRRRSRLT